MLAGILFGISPQLRLSETNTSTKAIINVVAKILLQVHTFHVQPPARFRESFLISSNEKIRKSLGLFFVV